MPNRSKRSSIVAGLCRPALKRPYSFLRFVIAISVIAISVGSRSASANQLSFKETDSLVDLKGLKFDLNSLSSNKALVLVAHGSSCPVMRQNYQEFKDLASSFKAKSVKFIFINPLTTDTKKRLEEEVANYRLDSEIFLTDPQQKILIAADLRTVGESAVLTPASSGRWNVAFRGGLSDRVNFDRAKEKPSKQYLKEALLDVVSGRPVKVNSSPTFGCSISNP